MQIEVRGEPVLLLPQRAVYLPKRKTLLVADLHWGKTDVFGRAGIAIPRQVLSSDLKRLGELILSAAPDRIVILGDLVHNARVLTQDLHREVTAWRALFPLPMLLVPGNHDRGLKLPLNWDIEMSEPAMVDGPFEYRHDLKEDSIYFVWSGHVHPMVRLRGAGDRLRCPCFVIGKNHGLLPAFSEFTGGVDLKRKPNQKIIALAGDQLVAL